MSVQTKPTVGEPTTSLELVRHSLASAMHHRGIALPDLDLQAAAARQKITPAQGSNQPEQGEPA
jgi:hypothetical protein